VKTYKYLIALVILVLVLLLVLRFMPHLVPATSNTMTNPAVTVMATSTDTGGIHTAQPSFVSVVPIQATPKITYIPASTTNIIRITAPVAGATVSASKPILVTGQAVGSWYFEASFPVILAAADGRVISQAAAKAGGDWMTTKFVPFTANITFVKQAPGTRGFIILKNDNPSGQASTSASVEIPVIFQ